MSFFKLPLGYTESVMLRDDSSPVQAEGGPSLSMAHARPRYPFDWRDRLGL